MNFFTFQNLTAALQVVLVLSLTLCAFKKIPQILCGHKGVIKTCFK